MDNPRKIPNTSKKEVFYAILGALIVLGFVGYAILSVGNNSANTVITGQVIGKKFVPRPEQQITIGSGGVRSKDKAGLYYLSIRANDSKEIYSVLVDEESYNRAENGSPYQIPKASLVSTP